MVFTYFGPGLWTCHSTDTKRIDGIPEGSGCIQWDDGKLYIFTSGDWLPTLVNSTNIRLANEAVEPTASSTSLPVYRHDIDTVNQAIYISKLENGAIVKVRLC